MNNTIKIYKEYIGIDDKRNYMDNICIKSQLFHRIQKENIQNIMQCLTAIYIFNNDLCWAEI